MTSIDGKTMYQAITAVGLVLVTFAQLAQGLLISNYVLLGVGLLGLVLLRPWSITAFYVVLSAGQIVHYQGRPRLFIFLEPSEVMLAAGTLAFTIGLLRLQSIGKLILPVQAGGVCGKEKGDAIPSLPDERAAQHVTPFEIAVLFVAVPCWVIFGQIVWGLLERPIEMLGFHQQAVQLLLVAWTLGIGLFVVGTFFSFWRSCHMSRATAEVYLQDSLWRDTRADQHRMAGSLIPFAWVVWLGRKCWRWIAGPR